MSRLPRPVTAVWDWQLHAACREIDSTTFFHPEYERGPEKDERDRRAKAVCRACPVIRACRRHALLVREPYGVWGGLTVAERTALLRRIDSATWPDHYPHHEPRSTIQPTEARQHG